MADKRPVAILAERLGGLPQARKDALKQQRTNEKAILNALADGPKTSAEIAAATGLEASEALWLVMALKKYGKIVEGEKQGDCYAYALTP